MGLAIRNVKAGWQLSQCLLPTLRTYFNVRLNVGANEEGTEPFKFDLRFGLDLVFSQGFSL